MRWVLVEMLAALYRWLISPAIHLLAGPGFGCRFQPSCGAYAHQSLLEHGFIRGGWFAVKRLLRCHPWSKGGWDPVPVGKGSGSPGRKRLVECCFPGWGKKESTK